MAFIINRDISESVTVKIELTDEELRQAYWEYWNKTEESRENGDYKQWIADVYHCSGCWGQKQTEEEMLLDLVESRKQADPEDYVPDATLYKECAAYWNDLCDRYPD